MKIQHVPKRVRKLIEFWTPDDDSNLKTKLTRDVSNYNYPSYGEVINYLKQTDAIGNIEKVMDDLIIQFIDDEFWLDNC